MKKQKKINKKIKNKYLYWIPRILTIIYIIFIGLFALDVFSENYGFPKIIVALFMHLLPTLILIGITIFAWKKSQIGGWTFIAISIVFTIFFKTYQDFIVFLIISLPLLITGILFLFDSKQNS